MLRGDRLPGIAGTIMLRHAVWFGIGFYTSYAAAMDLSITPDREPDRYFSEIGLIVLHFFMLPVFALMMAAIFLAWLAIRRKDVPLTRYRFLIPLLLGGSHPWLMMGVTFLVARVFLPAAPFAMLAMMFGLPMALGELDIRLAMKAGPVPL